METKYSKTQFEGFTHRFMVRFSWCQYSCLVFCDINDLKFKLNEALHYDGLFNNLEDLELRLANFGKDKRRNGRTSQNDWQDLLKRFAQQP